MVSRSCVVQGPRDGDSSTQEWLGLVVHLLIVDHQLHFPNACFTLNGVFVRRLCNRASWLAQCKYPGGFGFIAPFNAFEISLSRERLRRDSSNEPDHRRCIGKTIASSTTSGCVSV